MLHVQWMLGMEERWEGIDIKIEMPLETPLAFQRATFWCVSFLFASSGHWVWRNVGRSWNPPVSFYLSKSRSKFTQEPLFKAAFSSRELTTVVHHCIDEYEYDNANRLVLFWGKRRCYTLLIKFIISRCAIYLAQNKPTYGGTDECEYVVVPAKSQEGQVVVSI